MGAHLGHAVVSVLRAANERDRVGLMRELQAFIGRAMRATSLKEAA